MGKIVLFVVGLVVGAIGAVTLAGGAMMGAGAGAGIAAGMCSVVKAAVDTGAMTEEEVAATLTRATTDLGGSVPADADLANTVADCDRVMTEMQADH